MTRVIVDSRSGTITRGYLRPSQMSSRPADVVEPCDSAVPAESLQYPGSTN